MSMLEMYLWLKLGAFKSLLLTLAAISSGFMFVFFIIYIAVLVDGNNFLQNKIFSYVKISVFSSIFLFIIETFIPTTKEAIIIYAVPKMVNNKTIRYESMKELQLIKNTVNSWLEKQIESNKTNKK